MTQSQLVRKYVSEFGFIIPAHMANKFYGEGKFGSELPRTCRKLREKNVLDSRPDKEGYERFYFKENIKVFDKIPQAFIGGISVPIYVAPKEIKPKPQSPLFP